MTAEALVIGVPPRAVFPADEPDARITVLEAENAALRARVAELEARGPRGQVTDLLRRYDAEMFAAEVSVWERETGLPYYDDPTEEA
jgi:hypothetical protein